MTEITLKSLIQEYNERIGSLIYIPAPHNVIGAGRYEFANSELYQKWYVKTSRYLNIHFANDKYVVEFDTLAKEKLSPMQQQKMLAILDGLLVLPEAIPDHRSTQVVEKRGRGRDAIVVKTTINNSNSQYQSQELSIAAQLFIEAIKDNLTGRQIKELKTIVADADNDVQKTRPIIIDKLKSFGADVASNIVANLLTNPVIWSGI